MTRYKKDGFGYFAIILKETGRLIGQVGLMKNKIEGQIIVELGYILDNIYWNERYAKEASEACIRYAFEQLGLTDLYCSVRPENTLSIHLDKKLGMVKEGEHIVKYQGKDMLQELYVLKNN